MALTIDDKVQPTAENIALDNLRLEKGDIYGSVLWPAASALAQYLLTTVAKQTPLNNIRIFELGTGTGLVALAASMAGAKSVLATDYENIPLTILKHAMKVNYLKRGSSAGLGFEQMTDTLPNIKTGM
jgi:predicted nicotinamide N-methyase